MSLDPIQFYFDADERSFLDYLSDWSLAPTPPRRARATCGGLTGETEADAARDTSTSSTCGSTRRAARCGAGRCSPTRILSLTPGLFGRISIAGSQPYKGVLVPDEALGTDQDRRIVYVVGADNKVATKVVRPGPRIDGYRVIREGLKGDETIVVNGLMRVRPGIEVQPKMTELPPSREPAGG